MPWTYEAKNGAGVGFFDTRAEAEKAVATDPEFAAEVKGRKLVQFGTAKVQVIPDLVEHYNPTIGNGTVVRSRRHLSALQEQHGLRDFVPSGDQAERFKMAKERARRERG